jgi:hypothetical protein
MALVKMAAAARRAKMGSTKTIRRDLMAAGIPVTMLSPGTFAVEEVDLDRFLKNRQEVDAQPPAPRKSTSESGGSGKAKVKKVDKRRSR